MSCPHCGIPIIALQSVCPDCGTLLESVWPPPPELGEPLLPPRPKTLTGRVWTDFLLGAAVQYLTHLATARSALHYYASSLNDPVSVALNFDLVQILCAIGFGLIAYFALRPVYPAVARGSGYASEALLIVLLGAFVICQPVTY